MLLAVVLGGLLGVWVGAASGDPGGMGALAQAVGLGCEMGAFATLTILRALAIPLIVSSLVLGGVGLEAMRGMGRLVVKTCAWIVGSTAVAAMIGLGVGWCAGSKVAAAKFHGVPTLPLGWPEQSNWTWGWLGLVCLSLGFGYYRNQIEEGHGRLLGRFCQALEEMIEPLLRWTRAISAVGIFFLTASVAARHVPFVLNLPRGDLPASHFNYAHAALVLAGAVAAYLLALSLVVWGLARVNPWRLFGALTPAMLAAATGQSVEAALPWTMDAVRRQGGVSNRVAGPTLSICAVLHRDGVALLWTVALFCLGRPATLNGSWDLPVGTVLAAILLGCGGSALIAQGGLTPLLVMALSTGEGGEMLPNVLALSIALLGSAISVFSHACATLVIARSEGEYWVPGPQPAADEIQGLINQQALAES